MEVGEMHFTDRAGVTDKAGVSIREREKIKKD
jgi:hypothetical protein